MIGNNSRSYPSAGAFSCARPFLPRWNPTVRFAAVLRNALDAKVPCATPRNGLRVSTRLWSRVTECAKVSCVRLGGPWQDRASPAFASVGRFFHVLVAATSRPPAALLINRWRLLVAGNAHRVHPPECAPSLHARIRQPGWTAICLRFRPHAPVQLFLHLA